MKNNNNKKNNKLEGELMYLLLPEGAVNNVYDQLKSKQLETSTTPQEGLRLLKVIAISVVKYVKGMSYISKSN